MLLIARCVAIRLHLMLAESCGSKLLMMLICVLIIMLMRVRLCVLCVAQKLRICGDLMRLLLVLVLRLLLLMMMMMMRSVLMMLRCGHLMLCL